MSISAIPLFGWALDLAISISLAVPFHIIWTRCGIGRAYFGFLPAIYLAPPFWHCVGVFIIMSIIYTVFVPKLVSVSQTNNNKK